MSLTHRLQKTPVLQTESNLHTPKNATRNPPMPAIYWPQLHDQGASEFCDFIQGLSRLAESHYLAQIRRYRSQQLSESFQNPKPTSDIEQLQLFCDDEAF